MKLLASAAVLVAAAALASLALPGALNNHPAQAQQSTDTPERPLVFVPGLLGSMLCRPGLKGEQTVVWGTLDTLGQLHTLALDPAANDIEPCGLIHEVSFLGIFAQTVYGPFIDRLEAAGYREDETLFVFDYDWRLSVFDNASRLADFVDENIPGTGPIDIVAHSMGGLVARTYTLDEGGGARVARLVSAGTPWRGSVLAFQLLQEGMGFANSLIGGIEGFRRTMLSFPSTFELMPRYAGCCNGGEAGVVEFEVASTDAWAALHWPGIEQDSLPDLVDAAARQARLRSIIAQRLPAGIEEALVIGVDQRTPEQYDLRLGDGEAQLNVRTSWEGDGTVMRDSALLTQRVIYPTSFATHDAILSDEAVQDFVIAALAEGPHAAIATVPVRERTSILTVLGEFVELIGVAIATNQPVYVTGTQARLTVHLRLDVQDPVDAGTIKVTVARPGGPAIPALLTPDPAASDPTNPFEQSFAALVEVGETPGALTATVTLTATGAEPRVVSRVVPIVAQ